MYLLLPCALLRPSHFLPSSCAPCWPTMFVFIFSHNLSMGSPTTEVLTKFFSLFLRVFLHTSPDHTSHHHHPPCPALWSTQADAPWACSSLTALTYTPPLCSVPSLKPLPTHHSKSYFLLSSLSENTVVLEKTSLGSGKNREFLRNGNTANIVKQV